MGKYIYKYKFSFWLLLPLILLVFIFGYLYKEKYLSCVTKDFSMCLRSSKYNSAVGKFWFRYPQDYPLAFKTGTDLVNQYHFDDKYAEWVNFSSEFYPNAGGDRLGFIWIEKNSSYKDVHQYGDKEVKYFNQLPKQYQGVPPKIEYLKIAGEDAVRITTSSQPHSFAQPSEYYILIHNGELYRIEFDYNDYYHKLPVEYYRKGKELILSTFTFY